MDVVRFDARPPLSRRRAIDIAVCAAYVALATWLMHRLWADPDGRALKLNPADQVLNEWSLAHDTRLWQGELSFVTDRLNAPDGGNLMANASIIALGATFTPVTLLWGAATTHVAVLTFNLAATATAWYVLFRRGLRLRWGAAAVGGALCGFAPGMVSQSQSHLHVTAQFLVPAIVWCTLLLARTRRNSVPAVALGLLVALQVFIGEEVLLLTALGIGTFLGATGSPTVRRPQPHGGTCYSASPLPRQ